MSEEEEVEYEKDPHFEAMSSETQQKWLNGDLSLFVAEGEDIAPSEYARSLLGEDVSLEDMQGSQTVGRSRR